MSSIVGPMQEAAVRGAPIGGPGASASTDSIETLRGQIDAMDEAIVRLVAERAKLSARVQTARMNAGGTRVELGRERVILDTYRAALGNNGPALADAVLQVCRGAR
jgi:chorismate mutase